MINRDEQSFESNEHNVYPDQFPDCKVENWNLKLWRFDYSRDGIAHINIVDFLLGKVDINLS